MPLYATVQAKRPIWAGTLALSQGERLASDTLLKAGPRPAASKGGVREDTMIATGVPFWDEPASRRH